jgi:hypothetical protein
MGLVFRAVHYGQEADVVQVRVRYRNLIVFCRVKANWVYVALYAAYIYTGI